MTELPAGSVTVADLYRELVGMRADVARALERIAVIDSRNTDADRLHIDHEARLRTLERFRFTLMGASMAVSAVISAAGTWLGIALTHH